MENLLDNLKSLVKKDKRLVNDKGELLKNKVIELALKLDKDFIKLLLSNKKIKKEFFVDVNGTLIFDKDKFVKFVSNKQFLPDSYTAFKNKIGLIDEKGEFISEKKEVVLSWPYKDCVLEGGMTKEDQKRNEIFWNEILAPDEISRLFDPKVFTNAKRIDAKGEHLPAPRRFYVYVIRCENDSFYIGQTDDINKRWLEHKQGKVEWTRKYKPIEIVHYEEYETREQAVRREKELKTGFGRKWIKREFKRGRLQKWDKSVAARQAGKFDGFRIDNNGDIKDNLIIKGNNLLVLHSLKKRFAGKVKLIYIDPPYNTGGSQETFTYNNAFNHSTWMTFIKNRLEVAKELLTDDGFMVMAIDHNELFYLGALADEVFGRDNRLGVVCVLTNPRGRQFTKFFSVTIDFMLVYAKDKYHANFNKVAISAEKRQTFNLEDEKGRYRLENFIRLANIEEKLKTDRENYFYPIFVSPDLKEITLQPKQGYIKVLPVVNDKEKAWQLKKDTFKKALEENKEEYVASKDKKGQVQIYKKYREQQMLVTHWVDKRYNATFYGTRLLEKILGRKPQVSFPKSLYTIVDVLKIMTQKNDIVLDFFAGSGTTGHAVLELNKEDEGKRKFILVEQLDRHIEDSIERIQKVMQKENIKNDFIYLELLKWNQNFVEKIQKAKTKQELENLWETMKEKAFLSYNVDVKTIDERAKDFEDLSVEDQKRFLLECLDKNHLYVNYSEIDDEEYGVSNEDKKLNREFYGK